MSEYFEATLQIRNMRPEIEDFVNSEIRMHKIRVAKIEKHRNGIDLYLPSQSFAAALAKKLLSKFGGETNITTRLFGARMGKTIYRATVLYTASEYVPGDVVSINNKILLVKSVGKFISGLDLVSRKNTKIIAKGSKITKLPKIKTQITKNYPNLEVIHPETYQSVKVLNPKEIKKKEVYVVLAEKGIYLAE